MWNHDDAYKEDCTVTVGRGVVFGFIFGAALWGLIISTALYFFH